MLALLMGIMLILGLTSGLAYGQTPTSTVTPTVTPTPTPTSMPAPVLESIAWEDVDNANGINKGDILIFKFNMQMNINIITHNNIDSMLLTNPSRTYGQLNPLDDSGWTRGNTWLAIILGEDETIVGGETVNPANAVISIEGLSDNTQPPGPSIPLTSAQWLWWYTLIILIAVVVLIVVLIISRLKKGKGEQAGKQS